MTLRREFVMIAGSGEAAIRSLCRGYGISAKTAYKWMRRYREQGAPGLSDLPRRPHSSPRTTPEAMVEAIVEVRVSHRRWGGRKIRRVLENRGEAGVPSPSTITEILRRRGLIDEEEAARHRPWARFEHDAPNDLWQMDFKGHFAMEQGRCHPLTVLDDHSRFNIGLEACPDERGETVRQRLTRMFRRYGLPRRMLMDNGSPWGSDWDHPHTPLTVWMIRLGVGISHGRPYHPQTQGKDERFHRTLQVEVLNVERFRDLKHCQERFDPWRDEYNTERPHEALGMDVPASRYVPSSRSFPEAPPPIEYAPGLAVRKVQDGGYFHFHGQVFKVSKAFHGYPVALRPTDTDGRCSVIFCSQTIAEIDLRDPDPGEKQTETATEGG